MDNEQKMEKVTILPDPFRIMEDMYFAWEKAMGATMHQVVKSQGFADGLDNVLNLYLQYLKLQNDIATKYLKNTPFATRRDMARVAELVVSLETKIDRIEDYLIEEIYKAEEAEIEEEEGFHEAIQDETSLMLEGQTRLEERFGDLKEQMDGLEKDLVGIKETLKELKKALKSS